MAKPRFGKLTRVKLTDVWNGNGEEFLLWLSKDENLIHLSHELDLELSLESSGVEQQNQPAHLLCRETRTNFWTIVPGPFGESTDGQLGEILTIASGYSPVNIIWMTGTFHDEHRAVVDWLNLVTDETVNLFGMEIEFWRIGDSAFAPNFDIVSGPKGLVRSPAVAETKMTPRNEGVGAIQPSGMMRAAAASAAPEPAESASGMLRRTLPPQPEKVEAGEFKPVAASADPDGMGSGPLFDEAETIYSGSSEGNSSPQDSQPRAQESGAGNAQGLPDGSGTPSGMIRRWQNKGSTAVTPSGLLQSVQVSDENGEGASSLQRGIESNLTEPEQAYIEFWTRFWEDVVQWGSELPPDKPMSQGWVTFPIGREHFYLIAFINADHKLAGMGLVMDGQDAKPHFHLLYRDKAEIENEIGSGLDWRELPSRDESHIYLHKREVDPLDRSKWMEYQNWFAEALDIFTAVFSTRVQSLDAADYWDEEAVFNRL